MALHRAPPISRGDGIFDFRELVEEIYYEQMVDAFGNVPSTLTDVWFSLRNPVENTISTAARLAGNPGDDEVVQGSAQLVRWVTGNSVLLGIMHL